MINLWLAVNDSLYSSCYRKTTDRQRPMRRVWLLATSLPGAEKFKMRIPISFAAFHR